jgi:hypothetical protein
MLGFKEFKAAVLAEALEQPEQPEQLDELFGFGSKHPIGSKERFSQDAKKVSKMDHNDQRSHYAKRAREINSHLNKVHNGNPPVKVHPHDVEHSYDQAEHRIGLHHEQPKTTYMPVHVQAHLKSLDANKSEREKAGDKAKFDGHEKVMNHVHSAVTNKDNIKKHGNPVAEK